VAPGYVDSEHFVIEFNKREKGVLAAAKMFEDVADLQQAKDLGRQIATFHKTSRLYKEDHPEEFKKMDSKDTFMDGILKDCSDNFG